MDPLKSSNKTVNTEFQSHKRKIMTLNGEPTIEYHSHTHHCQNTLFSEENMLLVVIEGAISLSCGNTENIVDKYQMAFLKRKTLIEYHAFDNPGKQSKVEFVIFSVSYDLIKEFARLTQLPSTTLTEVPKISIDIQNRSLSKYISSLALYFDDTSTVDETLTKIKILELLFCLIGSTPEIFNFLMDFNQKYIPDLTSIVEDNLMNPISINQLADLCGRSLSSFRRDFSTIYNMPPSQWIRERRLKKACELLSNTNMTVTDICYTLGFENIAHFSRLFKSHIGASPSEFRVQAISA